MSTVNVTPTLAAPDLESVDVLTFVRPLLGFSTDRSFQLMRLDSEGILCELRAVGAPDTRFVVVPAAAFFPHYSPSIGDDVATELGLNSADDAVALLILTIGAQIATTTANTLAPVIVNVRSQLAAQVVIDDPTYAVRTPLPL